MAKGWKLRGEVYYSNLVIPRSGGKRHVEALGKDPRERDRLLKKMAVFLEEQNPRDFSAQSGRDLSIAAFMSMALENYRAGASGTYAQAKRALVNMLAAMPHIKTLADITPKLLINLREHYIKEGRINVDARGNPTGKKNIPVVNREIRQIMTMMRWAEDHDEIKLPIQNWRPVAASQLPEMKTRTLFYTAEQHAKLLAASEGSFMLTAYMFATHAGLRRAEIRHLRREDIDLENNIIHVRAKTWQDPRTGHWKQWFPKGSDNAKQRDRAVPVEEDGPFRPFLIKRLAEMPGEWVLSGTTAISSDVTYMTKQWAKIVRKSGVNIGSLHTLRHCFATELVKRGEPLLHVQEFMGHATLAMTMSTYNHFRPTRFATKRTDISK